MKIIKLPVREMSIGQDAYEEIFSRMSVVQQGQILISLYGDMAQIHHMRFSRIQLVEFVGLKTLVQYSTDARFTGLYDDCLKHLNDSSIKTFTPNMKVLGSHP